MYNEYIEDNKYNDLWTFWMVLCVRRTAEDAATCFSYFVPQLRRAQVKNKDMKLFYVKGEKLEYNTAFLLLPQTAACCSLPVCGLWRRRRGKYD